MLKLVLLIFLVTFLIALRTKIDRLKVTGFSKILRTSVELSWSLIIFAFLLMPDSKIKDNFVFSELAWIILAVLGLHSLYLTVNCIKIWIDNKKPIYQEGDFWFFLLNIGLIISVVKEAYFEPFQLRHFVVYHLIVIILMLITQSRYLKSLRGETQL